jgi:hypothetical protein
VLLLRGELAVGVDLAFADLLAGGEQFPARTLGEGVGADRGEQVVGGVQLVAGVEPPLLATEPLAVEQVGPGKLGPQRCAAQPLDRLGRRPELADSQTPGARSSASAQSCRSPPHPG